jgi:hypothetical protein
VHLSFFESFSHGKGDNLQSKPERGHPACLVDVPVGRRVQLASISSEISPERLAQLQSYGLLPNCNLLVLQKWPVIVVQVEHTELAIENDLARQIYICLD